LVKSLPNAQEYQVHELFLPTLRYFPKTSKSAPMQNEESLKLLHVGILGKSKLPDELIRACELVAAMRPITLIFAGYDVKAYLDRLELIRPWIDIREGLSDDALLSLMQEVDIGIQLRWPQHGESSGAIRQFLALRKPVIATAGGSFDEFAGAARLVSPDTPPEALAVAILETAQAGAPPGIEDFLARTAIPVWQNALAKLLRLDGASKRTEAAAE
jgi:glycosyltransferase involved in cell wall biosynthesis